MSSTFAESSPPNVVLLHGLGRSRFSMSVLGRFLGKNGFNVFNFGYPSRRASVDAHAQLLKSALQERFPKGSSLSFVTHSLGSIVVHRFATQYADEYRLQRAVMLGPPNQGAHMARVAGSFGILRRIIGPSLSEVQSPVPVPATDKLEIGVIAGGRGGARGLSPIISGDNDAIVAVEETKLPGIRDHVVVHGLHSFLMYQPRVHAQVLHFLRYGCFSDSKKAGPPSSGS